MPLTTETAFNVDLATALRGKHPRWREGDRIGAEQTSVFQGHPGLRPDIVIRHPGGAPVIVETEFEPAPTVEADATPVSGWSWRTPATSLSRPSQSASPMT